MFSGVLFFVFLFFFPLDVAEIILTKDGGDVGESRVMGTEAWEEWLLVLGRRIKTMVHGRECSTGMRR